MESQAQKYNYIENYFSLEKTQHELNILYCLQQPLELNTYTLKLRLNSLTKYTKE